MLDEIATGVKGHRLETLVEGYLSRIPQYVKNIRVLDWITPEWIEGQRDLLDALATAVTMTSAPKDGDGDGVIDKIPFRFTLAICDDKKELDRVNRLFTGTSNVHHAASYGRRLSRLWTITDTELPAWEARRKERGNVRELWHGTSDGNVLSILRTGLIVPPKNSSTHGYTGRLFGNGVYFSDQSTKALNYALNCAPGQYGRNRDGAPLMFLANVVMGNVCESKRDERCDDVVRRSNGKDPKGRPYDTIFAKGGDCFMGYNNRVLNNEMIVRDTASITLTHLCEFQR